MKKSIIGIAVGASLVALVLAGLNIANSNEEVHLIKQTETLPSNAKKKIKPLPSNTKEKTIIFLDKTGLINELLGMSIDCLGGTGTSTVSVRELLKMLADYRAMNMTRGFILEENEYHGVGAIDVTDTTYDSDGEALYTYSYRYSFTGGGFQLVSSNLIYVKKPEFRRILKLDDFYSSLQRRWEAACNTKYGFNGLNNDATFINWAENL